MSFIFQTAVHGSQHLGGLLLKEWKEVNHKTLISIIIGIAAVMLAIQGTEM